MPDLREVELRIAVAEGVVSRAEAEALGKEAREKQQSPLELLVARGVLSEDSYQSLCAEAANDPAWRATPQDASASTATMTAPPPASGEPTFPVAAWDRYAKVKFLGQGGMGMVFLARDVRLRREVAIKFVRGDDAEHVQRLIAEARTQARVRHERVCEVHEVGEVDGKVYIAMQYIRGKPLGALAGELTLEQKVMLVRGAAEGVHEAHRAGIIHRDVKPSNIMVERNDDGELRPYVMDFGLARSAQEAGTTVAGAVLGTPRYMAPEQAHGDAGRLDRRADIYSLGATLYHVLTGEPPVPGETAADVFQKLATWEPRPLRAIDPDIPIDLEAIVLKCLEKERSARYDSARALTDDLARFLNGEPVLARPAGIWYRLRKRLAKHRRLAVAGAVALAVLLGAIGWAVKTRLDAGKRERLARAFTEQVEQIEATARYSAQAPLHDLRGDRALITARMTKLGEDIRDAGDLAAAAGHYALGRGYLTLDDDDHALAELNAAWDPQAPDPRVAYTLAVVTGHLYRRALLAAERIEDRDQQAARRREIEAQYHGRLVIYLAASQGAGVAPGAVIAALIAFHDGQFDTALAQLDANPAWPPWDYEVPQLRGDILLARGKQRRDRGDSDLAARDFDHSRSAYEAAAAIGRSVPSIYESIGELEYAVLAAQFYAQDARPQAERALAAVRSVQTTLPDHPDALLLAARVRRTLAEQKETRGADVEGLLTEAFRDAKRAAEQARGSPQALLEMAQIQRQWGAFLVDRHEEPDAHFIQAIAISDRISERDRDAPYWGNLGLIYSTWADAQDRRGIASESTHERAVAAFEHALNIDSRSSSVWINLGVDWFKRGSQPGAKNPDGDLRTALDKLDTAKRIKRDQPVPYFYEGKVHAQMARLARSRRTDPEPEFTRALRAYRAGSALGPHMPHFHNGIGGVLMDRASIAREDGGDPGRWLDEAEAAFRKAIDVGPDQAYAYANVAEVYLDRASLQRARDEDPSASVDAALALLRQATGGIPKDTVFLTDAAAAHAIAAGYDLEHGREPERRLEAAADAIAGAIDLGPNEERSRFHAAEIRGLRARLAARRGHGDPDELAATAAAFDQAIAMAPDQLDHRIALAAYCRAWAMILRDAGRDPRAALDRGRNAIEPVLDRRPAWPDALVLRAALALQEAQRAAGATRRERAACAARDLAAAIAADHALGKVWGSQLALAQQLAGSQ